MAVPQVRAKLVSAMQVNAAQVNAVQGRARVRRPMFLLVFAAVMLAGCQSMETGSATAAQVRVVAASPDTAGMDFYAGGSALAYGMEFGAASSYVSLPAGANVRLAATTPSSAQTLASSSGALLPGRRYTAVVSNVAASLQETIYADQTQPAPAGQVAVRIIDAATRAGAVDVYLVPDSARLATTLPVRTGLGFGASTGYLQEPAGTYSLMIMSAGTGAASSVQTLLTGPQASYSPGAVRTIVLVDHQNPAEQGIDQIVAEDYEPDSARE